MVEPPNAELQTLLERSRADRFGPGFADRVMRRVEDERDAGFLLISPGQFLRVAAAALIVAVLLAGLSLAGRSADSGQTALEALFGLQPVTASAVYDAGAFSPLNEEAL